ncbi:hypothetical protein VCO01S_28160 [Vibrio comitans NBRC 102076]|uniref:Uncharacterized protein n=2 Tax=Vibrio comitans TaxID=413401 RepID=A0A4Y3IQ56_9VIBR|nr:hypothetical protein VCO01S_28160 [Vibrio comitans NBRC 102076]
MKKGSSIIRLASLVLVTSVPVTWAHLPSYEGERVRNSGHFETEGFSQPVRGECLPYANGPTDPNAGSANIYLGDANDPPNFFCAFTNQDDWSFEYPVDIIERSRTPMPDYAEAISFLPAVDRRSYLEEGYIPCDPDGGYDQCPRTFVNPMSGETTSVPGICIDVPKPDDPKDWEAREYAEEKGMEYIAVPDGNYHCAIESGSPRPRTSSVLMSTLTGIDDVDWAVYDYKAYYKQQPIVAAPQVPACEENLTQFVTFAYAGPLGMKDARSPNTKLFIPLEDAGNLPDEVMDKLPGNYGIRVIRPDTFRPNRNNPRIGYASGYAQNAWLLAPHSIKECIDSFEKCLEVPELNSHYVGNDIFFIEEEQNVRLYLMWWIDSNSRSRWEKFRNQYRLYDVSITTGVIDQFLLGDFISISQSGPFTGNGRYVHGKCSDPRRRGQVDMTIETN